MPRTLELEVANFVCRFGGSLVMNDLLEEVVLPAFFSEDVRNIRGTEYFFYEQEFRYLHLSEVRSLALCCRFVKNTILRRHQVYSATRGIVSDERELESAPSAIAVLLLQSHRLLYVREVPSAPSVHQFGATFRHRMRDAVMAYRNSRYEQGIAAEERITKKALEEQIPIPDVDVVPIVASDSLKAFIDKFASLNSLKIEIAPTNNEIDNEEFFRILRGSKKEVGSAKTVVRHHNPQGLDKDGCYEHVEAAKQGNALVEMVGKDANGDELKGDNTNFSVRASLGAEEVSLDRGIELLFSRYEQLKQDGVVEEGRPQEDRTDMLTAAIQSYQRNRRDDA